MFFAISALTSGYLLLCSLGLTWCLFRPVTSRFTTPKLSFNVPTQEIRRCQKTATVCKKKWSGDLRFNKNGTWQNIRKKSRVVNSGLSASSETVWKSSSLFESAVLLLLSFMIHCELPVSWQDSTVSRASSVGNLSFSNHWNQRWTLWYASGELSPQWDHLEVS